MLFLPQFLELVGTVFLFKNELSSIKFKRKRCIGFSDLFRWNFNASTGNIISAYQQKKKIPVITGQCIWNDLRWNCHVYYSFILNKPVVFDLSAKYILSLFIWLHSDQ